jgi:hypothetical protein
MNPLESPQLSPDAPGGRARAKVGPVPHLSPQAVCGNHKGRKIRVGWDYALRVYVAFDFTSQCKLFTCDSVGLLNVDLIVNEKQRQRFVATDDKPIHTWCIGRVGSVSELAGYESVQLFYNPYSLGRFCCYTGTNFSVALDTVYAMVLGSVDEDGPTSTEGVVPRYSALTDAGRVDHQSTVIKEINKMFGK